MGIFKPGRPEKYYPYEKRGRKPPSEPGLYRIRNTEGKVVYVGEAVDLNRRMHQHMNTTHKLRDGESFEYKTASGSSSSESRRKVEQQKIRKYDPERNLSKGGEGRRAKK